MARYKSIHTGLKILPVDFDQQVIPDSFEHALCHLVDHELDLTEVHARHTNDDEGAPAFDPATLIKIILLTYSRTKRGHILEYDVVMVDCPQWLVRSALNPPGALYHVTSRGNARRSRDAAQRFRDEPS